jgi:hypothetical protein
MLIPEHICCNVVLTYQKIKTKRIKMIEDLLKLFNNRDNSFEQATAVIAKQIDFVYEAIVEFLGENPHNISWDSVDINASNMIVIIARIFQDGIDPVLQYESQIRLLTIGIPFEVVQLNSKEAVVQFLAAMEKERGPKPAGRRTLSELISAADDGEDIDLLIAAGESFSQDLLDMLQDEVFDLDGHFDKPFAVNTFLSPYNKRTIH